MNNAAVSACPSLQVSHRRTLNYLAVDGEARTVAGQSQLVSAEFQETMHPSCVQHGGQSVRGVVSIQYERCLPEDASVM